MNPVVEEFCQRAADYVALVNARPVAESVPYSVAVARSKEAAEETLREDDRNQLLDQIVGLKEKVVKLEQDREHWMLETQLVRIKSEKRAKEAKEKAEERKSAGGKGEEEVTERAAELGVVETEEVGENEEEVAAAAARDREDVIKEHYVARIQELTAQLQVADSKSLHFYTDSITLQVG